MSLRELELSLSYLSRASNSSIPVDFKALLERWHYELLYTSMDE
jgi:hypothetical protein